MLLSVIFAALLASMLERYYREIYAVCYNLSERHALWNAGMGQQD